MRPIQYLGSKARLLEPIAAAVDLLDPERGPVVDLFSGSGVVAARFVQDRPTTAVDIQEYSRVLSSALLSPRAFSSHQAEGLAVEARRLAENRSAAVGKLLAHEDEALVSAMHQQGEPLAEVVENGSLLALALGEGPGHGALRNALASAKPVDELGVMTGYYGGVYFSYRQALQLDCLAELARGLPSDSRDAAVAAVLSAASAAASTVGSQFAQPIRPRDRDGRPKMQLLASLARKRQIDVVERFLDCVNRLNQEPPPSFQGHSVRADYREFFSTVPRDVSVVYADPPYTRDHYSRFYHVLETLALGDIPDVSLTNLNDRSRLSRGMYRSERHQSPFCIRSQAPNAFAELFSGVRDLNARLVVSYSPYSKSQSDRPRVLTVDQVAELAKESFSSVEVTSAGKVAHSKFNNSVRNGRISYEAEVLILCRP